MYTSLSIFNCSRYKISDTGIVENIKTNRVLKLHIKGNYYCVTLLKDNNKTKSFFIHKLVAKLYKSNIKKFKYINHKNGNKLENFIENLEWSNTKINNKINNNDNNEEWKEIKDIKNYEISNLGNIRNKNTKFILKQQVYTGYYTVKLYETQKTYMIHRLVANSFINNIDNKATVDHIDRNKLNNNVNNLMWATYSEQTLNQNYINKGMKRIIGQYSLNNILIKKWNSIKEAADYFNICKSYIKNNSIVLGFIWKYMDTYYLQDEIFKKIKSDNTDFKNVEISNKGRIKFKSGRISSGSLVITGYKSIKLRKAYLIHRLVMFAFQPTTNNELVVNHIDGDKSNNVYENLEWVTRSENNLHCVNILKKNCKPIIQYSLNMTKINEYKSIKDASIKININRSTINACLQNRNKTAKGFIFKYI